MGLALGETLDKVIMYYPVTILGVLLLFAGVELATVGAKVIWKSPNLEADLFPCFVTAGAYIGSKNMALGVSAGLIVASIQHLEQFKDFPRLVLGLKTPVMTASS